MYVETIYAVLFQHKIHEVDTIKLTLQKYKQENVPG